MIKYKFGCICFINHKWMFEILRRNVIKSAEGNYYFQTGFPVTLTCAKFPSITHIPIVLLSVWLRSGLTHLSLFSGTFRRELTSIALAHWALQLAFPAGFSESCRCFTWSIFFFFNHRSFGRWMDLSYLKVNTLRLKMCNSFKVP